MIIIYLMGFIFIGIFCAAIFKVKWCKQFLQIKI